MPTRIKNEVDRFLRSSKTKYSQFLEEMRGYCRGAERELGHDVVRKVYSRGEKQDEDEFKSAEKIALALIALRKKDPEADVRDVTDIVGITVVVCYPDNIDFVAKHLEDLSSSSFHMEKSDPVEKGGYHARHLVFRSTKAQTDGAYCEVQIKTMLHEAWSSKTHDLNYKPRGFTDDRLARMMQVFGASIQTIEVQSEVLRDLIHERWNVERQRRRIVGMEVFKALPTTFKAADFCEESKAIYADIQKDRDYLEKASPDCAKIKALRERIRGLSKTALRDAWWLASCLAVICPNRYMVQFASDYIHRFIGTAKKQIADGLADARDVRSALLAFYACGETDSAIRVSEELLEDAAWLDEREKQAVALNLANFLAEQAYFSPPLPQEEGDALRRRIDDLIAASASLEQEDPTAFHDLRGMVDVALSENPKTVRRAIDLIYQGNQNVIEEEKDIASAYFELHVRLAWRKLLELEARRT